jgi:uncharacterized protein (DUF1778 family)
MVAATPQKSGRSKSERLEARISREQKELFQRAADLQGRTLTDFVIGSVHAAALRAVEDADRIRLNARDSRVFADALLNPKGPSAELKAAARRYFERLGQ